MLDPRAEADYDFAMYIRTSPANSAGAANKLLLGTVLWLCVYIPIQIHWPLLL